jgi:hypothetical protein
VWLSQTLPTHLAILRGLSPHGSYPETGLGEINCNVPEVDFWIVKLPVPVVSDNACPVYLAEVFAGG